MLIIAALPFMSACGGEEPAPVTPSEGKVFELKMQNGYPPLHRLSPDAFHWWGKEIEQQSNGRIQMIWFDGATLAAGPDAYEAIRDGIADGGNIDLHREDPLFLSQQAFAVPYHFENSWQSSPAWWELLLARPELMKNFTDAGLQPVWVHTTDIFNFHSTKKIYLTPADSKGEILYSAGKVYEQIIASMGATPVTTPYEDTYTALERGMMTGLCWPWAPIRSAKLTDLLVYHTVLNISMVPWGGYMNQDTWNSFPSEIQQIFIDLGTSMSALCGATLTNEATDLINEMEGKGHTFHEPKGAERDVFTSLTGKPIEDAWIKDVNAQGFAAAEILAKADEIGKKYAGNAYGFDEWWGVAGRVWLLE
uniref:Putative TRAP transporter substrate-binding protein n=1 Tax=viral metagenome TaxID=1070528 RepID=A0A6M3M645_9ZZZZ